VRYCDDFIVGFQYRFDAEQFLADLKERFLKFGLELHPEKTRLIEFGRYATSDRKLRNLGKPETFDFLGLTHICGITRSGKFTVQRKTMRKRLQAKLKEVRGELRRRLHDPIPDVGQWLRSVVTGHCRYYGVTRNYRSISRFRYEVAKLWHRRSWHTSGHYLSGLLGCVDLILRSQDLFRCSFVSVPGAIVATARLRVR
jgi:RNA-directed DNA polymerase